MCQRRLGVSCGYPCLPVHRSAPVFHCSNALNLTYIAEYTSGKYMDCVHLPSLCGPRQCVSYVVYNATMLKEVVYNCTAGKEELVWLLLCNLPIAPIPTLDCFSTDPTHPMSSSSKTTKPNQNNLLIDYSYTDPTDPISSSSETKLQLQNHWLDLKEWADETNKCSYQLPVLWPYEDKQFQLVEDLAKHTCTQVFYCDKELKH